MLQRVHERPSQAWSSGGEPVDGLFRKSCRRGVRLAELEEPGVHWLQQDDLPRHNQSITLNSYRGTLAVASTMELLRFAGQTAHEWVTLAAPGELDAHRPIRTPTGMSRHRSSGQLPRRG